MVRQNKDSVTEISEDAGVGNNPWIWIKKLPQTRTDEDALQMNSVKTDGGRLISIHMASYCWWKANCLKLQSFWLVSGRWPLRNSRGVPGSSIEAPRGSSHPSRQNWGMTLSFHTRFISIRRKCPAAWRWLSFNNPTSHVSKSHCLTEVVLYHTE